MDSYRDALGPPVGSQRVYSISRTNEGQLVGSVGKIDGKSLKKNDNQSHKAQEIDPVSSTAQRRVGIRKVGNTTPRS
jgi:hypothetical protein